jgi:transcriptional regulator with XRE-family HTH domain
MNEARLYKRIMLRSEFQSLFWGVLKTRKREAKLTLKGLADRLGINKSYVTRSFSSPPNWQIDKIADMADALGVDLHLEARDRTTGAIYTPTGLVGCAHTESAADRIPVSSNVARTASGSPRPSHFVSVPSGG